MPDPNIITSEEVTEVWKNMPKTDLNPGDSTAKEFGCTCPYYPNRTRSPARKEHNVFYVDKYCPLHGWVKTNY